MVTKGGGDEGEWEVVTKGSGDFGKLWKVVRKENGD